MFEVVGIIFEFVTVLGLVIFVEITTPPRKTMKMLKKVLIKV